MHIGGDVRLDHSSRANTLSDVILSRHHRTEALGSPTRRGWQLRQQRGWVGLRRGEWAGAGVGLRPRWLGFLAGAGGGARPPGAPRPPPPRAPPPGPARTPAPP